MSSEKKPAGFQPGKSGNMNGRPVGAKNKPTSKLRRTLNKLLQLEAKSIENIEKSVNNEPVDKEALTTSKWVVSTVMAISKAALAEEMIILDIGKNDKDTADEFEHEQSTDTDPEPPRAVFSLHMLPTKKDL